MDSEKDFLDKLYSDKFEKFEFQSSGDDWANLNSKLGKSNFLKFSFATFNIFILGAVIAFAGSATYLGVNHILQNKKIETLEKKVEVLQKQINNSETNATFIDSASLKNQKNTVITEIKTEITKKDERKQNVEDEKKTLQETNIKKDSIIINPDTSSIIKTDPQKIKKIKKTVFIKQDKVIVADTVWVKKKKK